MSFRLKEADFYLCFHPEALCDFGQGIKLPELPFASVAKVVSNEQYLIYLEGGLNGSLRMSLAQSWANSKPQNWQRAATQMLPYCLLCDRGKLPFPSPPHAQYGIGQRGSKHWSIFLLAASLPQPPFQMQGDGHWEPRLPKGFHQRASPCSCTHTLLTVFLPPEKLSITWQTGQNEEEKTSLQHSCLHSSYECPCPSTPVPDWRKSREGSHKISSRLLTKKMICAVPRPETLWHWKSGPWFAILFYAYRVEASRHAFTTQKFSSWGGSSYPGIANPSPPPRFHSLLPADSSLGRSPHGAGCSAWEEANFISHFCVICIERRSGGWGTRRAAGALSLNYIPHFIWPNSNCVLGSFNFCGFENINFLKSYLLLWLFS